VKTALESIDGTGSYNFNVPAERIQLRALDKSGTVVKGNVLGPRPCIVIWVQAPDAGEPRTVDEYTKTLLILVGMYLDATADGVVDELDRLDSRRSGRRRLPTVPSPTIRTARTCRSTECTWSSRSRTKKQ